MLTLATKSKALEAIDQVLSTRKLDLYQPYPKQKQFHDQGGEDGIDERLLIAGNQLGKTRAGAMETAAHLSGLYPDWWDGAVFEKAVYGWAGAPSGELIRDNPQLALLGPPGEWGTGAIPKKCIVDIQPAPHGVKDQVGTIIVRHTSGKLSRLGFKSYDQGRRKWQGATLNFVWNDEEPEPDVYSEGKTRVQATKGIVYTTFTPLLGSTEIVRKFMLTKPPGTAYTMMGIADAGHYSEADRIRIIAGYPAHEREARAYGTPMLGSGPIYGVEEPLIMEGSIQIPNHWPRLCAMDIGGWDHPTAGVWMAWDRDTDTVHLYDAYRVSKATPAVHSASFLSRGKWMPIAWPHDALQHDKGGSCETIANQYRTLGMNMLVRHATHAPGPGESEGQGGYGREAGIMAVLERLQSGRLKVSKHLGDWWDEYRLYHRKEGIVVKENDDLMDATRIAIMMLRFAKLPVKPKEPMVPKWQPSDASMGVMG